MQLEAWKTFFEIGGVTLLFFTFVFGSGAYLTTNRLNQRQAAQLREFDKQLTDAKTKLGRQQERAANADARVAGLETEASNAKLEMAKQQTRAANAETALLELQQRLAHRRISQSDHDKLVASLRPFRGAAVQLSKVGDAEAAQFADDLLAVLHDAGWSVSLHISGIVVPPTYGLLYSVDESTPAGHALAVALRRLPTANVRPATLTPPFVASIFVGLKPPA
jgi:predicted negative regulator of RcsB-dependent stress response